MGRNIHSVAIGVCFGLLAVTVSGCASSQMRLADQGIASVEILPSDKAQIVWVDAYRDGEVSVVYGAISRHRLKRQIKVHVDITLLSPDGTILEKARTADISVPRRSTVKGSSLKRFAYRFTNIPAGSSLVLAVHDCPHDTTPSPPG